MKPSGFCYLILITAVNCELLKLRDGFIEGIVGKSRNGRKFQIFYAIPYAKPPVGELRFKVPVPVKPWSGTKNTTKPPPMCLQSTSINDTIPSDLTGQEDCLYLNVHTPMDTAKESAKAPVIVYIHGGGFISEDGAANNPHYFMDRNVVFVTINYRLGVLGFLSMNNDHISGNFGMKDQVLALQWVKDNIAAFGGNPDSVTLMGESTGAGSVHLHMFSPLSQGLFHKAIMQSGNAFASVSYDDDFHAEAAATTFIMAAGCFHRDPIRVLRCLQRIPVDELFAITRPLKTGTVRPEHLWFKMSIESKVLHRPFLSQIPTTNYLTKVPWLIGINSGEAATVLQEYFQNDGRLFKLVNENRNLYLPQILDYHKTADPEDWDNITSKVANFYFGNNSISSRTSDKIVQMYTDNLLTYSLTKSLKSTQVPRYVYLYDHTGSVSCDLELPNITMELGACHGDELSMLFRDETEEFKWSPQDKKVSEILLNNWINFATYSDPNGLSKEKLWKPVETDEIEYLHIKSDSVKMEKNFLRERRQLWESLPLRRNKNCS